MTASYARLAASFTITGSISYLLTLRVLP
jgi:hypothetical protein